MKHISIVLFTLLLADTLVLAQGEQSVQAGDENVPGKNAPDKELSEWTINKLTDAPHASYRWFTMDAFNDELHVLYFHSGKPDYKPNYLIYGYSNDNGISWHLDTIDGSPDLMAHVDNYFSIATFNAAIAVDHCGIPHVFYTVNYFHHYHRKPSYAVHAQKVNGRWIRDTVEARDSTQSMIKFDVDMVIGTDNEPRVVYLQGVSEPMLGIRKHGRWYTEPIQGVEGTPYLWNSLALDNNNEPHIVLGKLTSLEYAVKNGGDWTIRPVLDNVNGIGDIALSRSGTPHITYSAPLSMPFRHATLEKGAWQTHPIESVTWNTRSSGNGKRARIKRDAQGTLHAVYYGHNEFKTNGYLVYAWSTNNGKHWDEEIVEDVGRLLFVEGTYPDLVITGNLIGLFYKGPEEIPRFAYKKHHKPGFRRIFQNDCPQQ